MIYDTLNMGFFLFNGVTHDLNIFLNSIYTHLLRRTHIYKLCYPTWIIGLVEPNALKSK
ncbi:hypothetical protein ASPZODRAFT_134112 [Penicilliopsis zonata CBS 506.65]|uniref:Uncharacterized protein n=1 Tax=Penicilliopsis zonata CBS 506.65 TaxID=1073090 RepID=A0A1L9SEC1_9EURO|nr:hypothetical protein ASPZODRAFT_134112 [Penicilliopsis zonata CBS 506.65]OJJ45458.1 hypothetical protein ASPZODRAFT_134112 [Penicilliopsis zonata CBS 506.65]